jgi:hypothetical protein
MDAATLQSRIYSGYSKAALRVGYLFTHYRPSSASTPIASGNSLGTLNAAFTVASSSAYTFAKAGAHKDVLWNGLFDGSQTQVGDYLSDPVHGTYFVAAQQDQTPILTVRCSHVISVVRVAAPVVVGVNPYGGTTAATEVPLLTGWPAALTLDARGRVSEVGLPLDLPSAFFVLLMPAYGAVRPEHGDIVTDDNNPDRRYTIAGSELTALGWRMILQQAIP